MGCSPSDLTGRRFQELLTMGGRIFHQTHWAPLMKLQGSVAEVKLDLLHTNGHVITDDRQSDSEQRGLWRP